MSFDQIYSAVAIQLNADLSNETTIIEVATDQGEHIVISVAGADLRKIRDEITKMLEAHPQIANWHGSPRH